MVRDYVTELYEPAAASATRRGRRRLAPAARRWRRGSSTSRVAWPAVKVDRRRHRRPPPRTRATNATVRARVELGALHAGDVTVQCCTAPSTRPARSSSTPDGDHAAPMRGNGDVRRHATWSATPAPTASTVRCLPTHAACSARSRSVCVAWADLIADVADRPDSAAGELGLAGAVLEEALHADLAVVGVEDLVEQPRSSCNPSASGASTTRRRRPA